MFLNTLVKDEVIEGEVGGVIVRVTKRHIVTVPVEIDIDLATGMANVTTYKADVSCLITSDVVDVAPPTPKPARVVGKRYDPSPVTLLPYLDETADFDDAKMKQIADRMVNSIFAPSYNTSLGYGARDRFLAP